MKSLLGRPSVHQVLEYAVGFALAGAAVRSGDRVLLSLAALAVIANTALLEGPLAAYAKVPRALHRVIDVVLGTSGIVLAVVTDSAVATRAWLASATVVVVLASVRFTHVVRETRS